MKIKISKILLTVFFILFIFVAFAQKEPPKPGPPPPVGLPIDGGLSILMFAGVVFVAFKLRERS